MPEEHPELPEVVSCEFSPEQMDKAVEDVLGSLGEFDAWGPQHLLAMIRIGLQVLVVRYAAGGEDLTRQLAKEVKLAIDNARRRMT